MPNSLGIELLTCIHGLHIVFDASPLLCFRVFLSYIWKDSQLEFPNYDLCLKIFSQCWRKFKRGWGKDVEANGNVSSEIFSPVIFLTEFEVLWVCVLAKSLYVGLCLSKWENICLKECTCIPSGQLMLFISNWYLHYSLSLFLQL